MVPNIAEKIIDFIGMLQKKIVLLKLLVIYL